MNLLPIFANVLSVRIIPNVEPLLAKKLKINDRHRSLGIFTVDMDDIGVTALDEATKRADVEVAYAQSFYAGADHSSGPLSGEFIGILSGPNPDEVKSGIQAVEDVVESGAHFEALNEEKTHALYAHVVSRTGSFLSKEADIEPGQSLAYLIAPPLESTYGIDAALKSSDVKLSTFYGPPTETNFGGGLVTGSQASCQAAADAFRDAVIEVANAPKHY
ncbi:ethanolamine utilization microcompartment protein EutL [Guptibacillus algicola]|uniref:ethanolamine utilization microcompartment protein EutL n=1 Tax=Guptibacillus algicola TaxID=225844 RepID=UPI001CD30969|nr:ethanolamine utilization microcompartment protein EutL [Alkalihalobacillus algicola]MCA0988658.1 ethanolamine utilization microcompartment protein EutL [Alkalihalobacillus algicola]